jgi:hypothetical protein
MKFCNSVILFLLIVYSTHGQTKNTEIQRITNDASYEFSNIKMYKDEMIWRGKMIGFSGVIQKTPVIAKTKGLYLQVSGQTASGYVNVVVFLDSPLPLTDNYGNAVPLITAGMDIRIFVQLKELQNCISETGYVLNLPTADGLLIFSKDDYSMVKPLWISTYLRRN